MKGNCNITIFWQIFIPIMVDAASLGSVNHNKVSIFNLYMLKFK